MTFRNFCKTPYDNAMHPMFCCVICKSVVTVIISVCDILQTSGSMEAVRPTQTMAKASGSRLEPRFQLLKAATRAAGEFATVSKWISFSSSFRNWKWKWTLMFVLYIMRAHLTGLPQGSNADDTFRIHWDLTIPGTFNCDFKVTRCLKRVSRFLLRRRRNSRAANFVYVPG